MNRLLEVGVQEKLNDGQQLVQELGGQGFEGMGEQDYNYIFNDGIFIFTSFSLRRL